MTPNPDRVARLITGELVPAATVEDYEAAMSLLAADQSITDALTFQSLRALSAEADRFMAVFPDWGGPVPGLGRRVEDT